jgi:hypothetical protein
MSHTDITTRVAFFSEFTSEEFIEFSTKYTVGYELSLFTDLSGHLDEAVKRVNVSRLSAVT